MLRLHLPLVSLLLCHWGHWGPRGLWRGTQVHLAEEGVIKVEEADNEEERVYECQLQALKGGGWGQRRVVAEVLKQSHEDDACHRRDGLRAVHDHWDAYPWRRLGTCHSPTVCQNHVTCQMCRVCESVVSGPRIIISNYYYLTIIISES